MKSRKQYVGQTIRRLKYWAEEHLNPTRNLTTAQLFQHETPTVTDRTPTTGQRKKQSDNLLLLEQNGS